MDLQITGRVIELLEEQSGEGRNGPWRKREFILETEGNYPKSVCVVMWGDDIDKFAVEAGERLTAHIDIQSREFKGRWYTDVKAWKVEKEEAGSQDAAAEGTRPGTRRGAQGRPAAGARRPAGDGPGGFGGSGGSDASDASYEDDDLPF